MARQLLRVPTNQYGWAQASEEPYLEEMLGEAVFVSPEMGWLGLHELHRRGLGDFDNFQLPTIPTLTPHEAIDAFDRSSGFVLGQMYVEGPERGRQAIDSIESYLRDGGGLGGLEGLLISSALTADRDGQGVDELQRAAGLLNEFGVSAHLGAGRGATPVLDADRFVGVGKEIVNGFVDKGLTGAGGQYLRGELDGLLGTGGAPAEHGAPAGAGHHGGGGFDLGRVFTGALEVAAGAAAFAANPFAGTAIILHGAHQVVDGLAQGRPGQDTPPGTTAEGTKTVETKHEKITYTHTKPDGSTEQVTKETYTTKMTLTGARSKDEGGPGSHGPSDKLWDDVGGGWNPETGQPEPVNPIAVLLCPPGPDGNLGTGNEINGPKRGPSGAIEDFGDYDALAAILDATPQDGLLHLAVVFDSWTIADDGTFVPPVEFDVAHIDPSTVPKDKGVRLTPDVWNRLLETDAKRDIDVVRVTPKDGPDTYVGTRKGSELTPELVATTAPNLRARPDSLKPTLLWDPYASRWVRA